MDTHDIPVSTNVQQVVPFFMVTEMKGSLEFYQQLGFSIRNQWEPRGHIEWCWLQFGNAALMLQEYRQPVTDKLGVGTSVCFMCDDALPLYEYARGIGVSVNEPFVGNNMWVVGFTDPDGYKLFFESSTNVAEETTYAQWKENKLE
jgi:lactoylglutathione lyase